MLRRWTHSILSYLLICPISMASEDWDAASETLVVYNPSFKGSAELAAHYAAKRLIPADRIIALPCPVAESMERTDFDRHIRDPLRMLFKKERWTTGSPKPVRVLVTIRGVPFRIKATHLAEKPGRENEASVDSELACLLMEDAPLPAFVPNPYFKQTVRFPDHEDASHMLLVARLDGPDDATVRRMIDDAVTAENEGLLGRAVIDLALRDGTYELGEEWLRQSARTIREAGIPLYVDRRAELIPAHWPLPDTILYFGWYQQRIDGALATPSFRFARGAVACHLYSFSAGDLRSADEHWVGPMLARGACAALGNVWEPYLPLTVHFDLLNRRLLEGFTLAEAAWSGTPGLSWMTVIVGDPLYRPFQSPPGSRLGQDRIRDYAIFHGLLTRHAKDPDKAALKTEILKQAERRKSPHLVELLGLLSWQNGNPLESAQLFDHAASWFEPSADKIRCRLYQAEALRQDGDALAARAALSNILEHPAAATLNSQLPQ